MPMERVGGFLMEETEGDTVKKFYIKVDEK